MKNLIQLILHNCRAHPAKIALEVDGSQLTYQAFGRRISEWSAYFTAANIKTGSRVMLLADHRIDFLAAFLALWANKCIPVPLEPTIAAAELQQAVEAAQAHWIISANPDHRAGLSQPKPNPLQPGWLVARGVSDAQIDAESNAFSFFIYTSGTTGKPKCVIYDHSTVYNIIHSLIKAYSLTQEDVIYTPLTPALSATFITGILPGLAQGATVVLPSQPVPGRVLKEIASTGTTIFFAVPYFYELLIDAMDVRQRADYWQNVRLTLSTSAFLPGHTFDAFYAHTQLPIRSIYCTSEANQCTFNHSPDKRILRDSVGKPHDCVQLKIVDAGGNELSGCAEGQIVVQGGHRSFGYYQRPEAAAKVYQNGWVHTGDLGFLDQDGNLFITGRLSDTVNVSGHLVNPQEVEEVLLAHPAVSAALVLGEGDHLVGEQVVGWVIQKPGQTVSDQTLKEFCRQSLIHYKVPQRIEFVPELPVGRYGKIRRVKPVEMGELSYEAVEEK